MIIFQVLESVSDGLRKIYKQKLYPLEEFYRFHEFHSPALGRNNFIFELFEIWIIDCEITRPDSVVNGWRSCNFGLN